MPKLKISNKDPEKIFKVFGSVDHVHESTRYNPLRDRAQGPSFKAWNRYDQYLASIEVLKEDLLDDDRAFLETELAILEQCHSPFIVSYKGTYRKEGNLWIVTEYCAGGSLGDLMEICDMVLDEEQIACVMKMALQGLDYLHGLGVIHRDIKGGSIFITQSGDCKLANVGLAGLSIPKTTRNTQEGFEPLKMVRMVSSNLLRAHWRLLLLSTVSLQMRSEAARTTLSRISLVWYEIRARAYSPKRMKKQIIRLTMSSKM